MPDKTMAEFIDNLRKDADAAFPYDVDYMNVVNGIADRVEEVWEREREKADAMREALVKVKKLFDGRIMWQPEIREAHEAVNAALAAQEGGAE